MLQRLRQRRRVGVGHIARARTRGRAHQMNADDLGRSRTCQPDRRPTAQTSRSGRHAYAAGRPAPPYPPAQSSREGWRNVVAEVDNRRAALRQRPVLAVSSVRAVSRVIGRNAEPVLVNRQVGRRPPGSDRIRPRHRQRRGRGVAVLVGDRVVDDRSPAKPAVGVKVMAPFAVIDRRPRRQPSPASPPSAAPAHRRPKVAGAVSIGDHVAACLRVHRPAAVSVTACGTSSKIVTLKLPATCRRPCRWPGPSPPSA